MKAITTQSRITSDGKLCLELQTGLPAGPAEVVVVVASRPEQLASPASLSGMFAGAERSEQEVMDYLRQLRRATSEASWELTE